MHPDDDPWADDGRRLVDAAAAWPDDAVVAVPRTADGRGTCTVLRDLRRWFTGVSADATPADGLPTVPVSVVRMPEHHRAHRPG